MKEMKMIDRAINVMTLCIVTLAIVVFSYSFYNEYTNVAYQYNISDFKNSEKLDPLMKIKEDIYLPEDLLGAISSFNKEGKYEIEKSAIQNFQISYKKNGDRRTRVNSMNWLSIFINSLLSILLLLFPLMINYIRHEKIGVWNRRTN